MFALTVHAYLFIQIHTPCRIIVDALQCTIDLGSGNNVCERHRVHMCRNYTKHKFVILEASQPCNIRNLINIIWILVKRNDEMTR